MVDFMRSPDPEVILKRDFFTKHCKNLQNNHLFARRKDEAISIQPK
jgi:hypothetical protein